MKQLIFVDYLIIAVYVAISFLIGHLYTKRASSSLDEYFLSGRKTAWWLIGLSMAATNYSIDTPLAITKLVAKSGIMGTWYVWSLAMSGIATTFFFSRLWRRARVVTDAEVIKYRYSGRIGDALRIFKGIYFGVLINCFVLGWVFKALTKVMSTVTPWKEWQILTFFVFATLIYTMTGGLSAVVMTDCIQYGLIIFGAVALAVYSVSYVGGLDQMMAKIETLYPSKGYLDFFPSLNSAGEQLVPWSAMFVYLFIQWWANKYSDGGGKHIQRMSSARDETHAVTGTFMYSLLYVLSTWPIAITALCSLIVFQGIADPESGYPLLMTKILPNGMLGLCVVGLLAAFMSTVSTHLNLGASYMVNDIYKAFFVKHQTQDHYVKVSKAATVLVAVSSVILSLFIESVADTWQFVLSFASGAGVVWILRWFWWRINAYSEFAAMTMSAIVATYLEICHPKMAFTDVLLITVFSTIPVFVLITFLTKPVNEQTLRDFYLRVKPGELGWKPVMNKFNIARDPYLSRAFVNFVLGIALLFCLNFGVGTIIFKSAWLGIGEILVGLVLGMILLMRIKSEQTVPDPEDVPGVVPTRDLPQPAIK